jgi:hypothetical protein
MAGFFDDRYVPHIFRDALGHVPDTEDNRGLLIDTHHPDCRLGEDRFGNVWYARVLKDGRQVWIQVRNFRIRNGGINLLPRKFDPLTGLSGSEA